MTGARASAETPGADGKRQVAEARREWAMHWPVPLTAMIGTVGASCFSYSSGIFIGPVTREFGWSRAEFSVAFVIQMLVGLVMTPLAGWICDRVGPRRVALAGIPPFVLGLLLPAFANGDVRQWWALCAVQALLGAAIGPAVWVKGIVGRFNVSRGLALATGLAGLGVGIAVWPILATLFVEHAGWRAAYPLLGLCWGLIIFPLTLLCFRSPITARVEQSGAPATMRADLRRALLSRTFLSLAIAGSTFSAIAYGLILNMVPLLQTAGITTRDAAAIAGLAGVLAVGGRLVTGLLLDLLPTKPLVAAIFLLPVAVAALLLLGAGSRIAAVGAVVVLGFFMGAESDIMAYLVSKRFGAEVFASLYAAIVAVFSIVSSSGPLFAALSYDRFGSYEAYLLAIPPLSVAIAVLIMFTPLDFVGPRPREESVA